MKNEFEAGFEVGFHNVVLQENRGILCEMNQPDLNSAVDLFQFQYQDKDWIRSVTAGTDQILVSVTPSPSGEDYSDELPDKWLGYTVVSNVFVEANPCADLHARVPDNADIQWWVENQLELMNEESRDAIRSIRSASDMSQFHFPTGMAIRNYYGLWHENGLTRYFNDVLGVYHADDMSAILLEALWHEIHNKFYDPKPTIERFQEHWKGYGCNMKGEKVNA